ncbi:antitoxin Xre/MbcA/ParS-like domain-containing protein [Pseudaminobacter sp. NGMCC 1.201702]|uniref:antitoxin Xre/MbcA/ParS-like domain-containing protein n=1 Tax=Pseudaminobacter sp. NGMCC 1.201702 TaxID=3391825 RepID=UPI0039EEE3D6
MATRESIRVAGIIAGEVEDVVARYATDMSKPAILLCGRLAGEVVAMIARLPEKRQRQVARSQTALLQKLSEEIALAATLVNAGDTTPERTNDEQPHEQDISVDKWAGPTAGPTYLERHFGIARSTLHRWQRQKLVIGLRKGARKYVFPLAQFVDGRPVTGLAEIAESFPNQRLAWLWMISPCDDLGQEAPIDLLRLDEASKVIEAAMKSVDQAG